PEKSLVRSALDSAIPSSAPTASMLVPSTETRKSGRRLWISSDEASISMETKPSVHTPRGIRRHTARRSARSGTGTLRRKIERRGEVTHLSPHARQRLETEATRDEFDDRRRIVGRMVDDAALGVRRNDDGRNTGCRTPSIASRRWDVIPEPAVFIVSDDDGGAGPQRARLDASNELGDMRISRKHVGVSRMLVEATLRLVENDLGKLRLVDAWYQI